MLAVADEAKKMLQHIPHMSRLLDNAAIDAQATPEGDRPALSQSAEEGEE